MHEYHQNIHALQHYALPQGVLPKSPSRVLFDQISVDSLTKARALSLQHPEKRGTISHAVRALEGTNAVRCVGRRLIIEAHIDGRDFPAALYDDLVGLGFEPDGFVRFVPDHFNVHLTSKFALSVHDQIRARHLRQVLKTQFDDAHQLLCSHGVEAYVELETYSSANRSTWIANRAFMGRDYFPVSRGQFRFDEYGEATKRADIHIKLSDTADDRVLRDLLIERGFYWVQTWAGNIVCTAEFSRARHAKRVYQQLRDWFDRYGGPVEMTLECVLDLKRTQFLERGTLIAAATPPLITMVE